MFGISGALVVAVLQAVLINRLVPARESSPRWHALGEDVHVVFDSGPRRASRAPLAGRWADPEIQRVRQELSEAPVGRVGPLGRPTRAPGTTGSAPVTSPGVAGHTVPTNAFSSGMDNSVADHP